MKIDHFKYIMEVYWNKLYFSALVFHLEYQSPFKTSHFTRRPSLKRLSGIQVQLLSLWMGKHHILQSCLPSFRLNFIFEITNEIWQQLSHFFSQTLQSWQKNCIF